jgi:drug/metabolite transporter (DMT)-like permease
MNFNGRVQTYSIITLAIFIWSFSEIIVKLLQGSVGPITLSFFRFFFGGTFLLIILIIKNDLTDIYKMFKDNIDLFIISSCFAFGISNILYFIGITYTQVNIAATIYSTYTIWITIYSIYILNERTNLKLKFLGLIIGLIGVSILMINFNFLGLISFNYLLGNLLVLFGSLLWGLYSVLGKKIQLKEKGITNLSLKFSMLSSILASIPNFIILIFTPEYRNFLKYDFSSWILILFLGIMCTGLGIYLLFIGLKQIELSKGMSLALLKPIFVTILAFIIINESPTISLYISIILIILSILIINRKSLSEDNNFEKD